MNLKKQSRLENTMSRGMGCKKKSGVSCQNLVKGEDLIVLIFQEVYLFILFVYFTLYVIYSRLKK